MADADAEAERAELTVFSSKEAYVYKIPPASTIGHRADTWGVEAWLQVGIRIRPVYVPLRFWSRPSVEQRLTYTVCIKEVSCAVVTRGDDCVVRLTAEGTGELFAECPVPKDQPLTTVSPRDPLDTL